MQLTPKLIAIVDNISRDRQALLASVEGLDEQQVDFKPSEAEWSIGDLLHHLALTHEAAVKLTGLMLRQAAEKDLPPDPAPEESILDSLDGFGELLKNRIQAPERVAPKSHLSATDATERLHSSRGQLLEAVGELARYDLSQLTYPHPLLGDLNGYQWLLVTGKHESRHAGQIERIKTHEKFPRTK